MLVGIIASGEFQRYRAATQTTRSIGLALQVESLIQELQNERGLTAGILGGNVSFRDELPPARALVDNQKAAVLRLTDGGGQAEDRVRAAVAQLDALGGVRSASDSGVAERAATFRFFTDRIAALAGVDFGLGQATDRELQRGLAALESLNAAKEATAQERALLNGVFSAGGFVKGEFVEFAEMRAEKRAALERFDQFATDQQRRAQAYVLDTGAARTAAYFEQVALEASDGRNLVVNPQSWWSANTTVLDDTLQLQQYIGSVIVARSETLQNFATVRIGGLLGIVLLFLGIALILVIAASRSITRPLAALATEADYVASQRLPDAVRLAQAGDDAAAPAAVRVPERASLEIRSLADALNRVQGTAYSLATEQATLRRRTTESMANLGRRNQNLLRRQLGFISDLEREETDPSGLANLFELDHLATRMRRNAESLLVLAGASTPRQWSSQLPITDVIRAATSEVEEYRRVTMRRIDDAHVSGGVVSGIAHMLAELIENGLQFSPPDTDVEIQGRSTPSGYLIVISDQGIGLNGAELDRANARLRGGADFLSSPTQYLGHHVVGRLARQMGIDVQLVPSPVTGITARVLLPNAMIADRPPITSGTEVLAGSAAGPPSNGSPARGFSGGSPSARNASRYDEPVTAMPANPVTSALPSVPAPVRAMVADAPTQPMRMIDARPNVAVEYMAAPDLPPAAPSTAGQPGMGQPVAGQSPPRRPLTTPPLSARQLPGVPPSTMDSTGGRGAPGGNGLLGAGGAMPPGAMPPAPALPSQPRDAAPVPRSGPPSPPPPPPPSGGPNGTDAEWTRNGLRKRPARNRAESPASASPAAAAEPAATPRPSGAEVDHSPREVQNRLTSLRAGMRRGETERFSAVNGAQHGTTDPGSEHR